MSRYFSDKFNALEPYVPGEQPKDMCYVKLNTNESPFPPSQKAQERAQQAMKRLQLYSDPQCTELVQLAAECYNISESEILFTNGSDEGLNFAFMAYCDDDHPAAFPDITYGFYPVFAELNQVPYKKIPLQDDFTIAVSDYVGIDHTIFIANPNAPTGKALSLEQIEMILRGNPDHVVVIDEAYVDFGAESAVSLIHKYDNLLVVQTFSKSRSMAGARLGLCIGCKELIADLQAIKYSTNPYNVNSMTMAAGIGALEDDDYFRENCQKIINYRGWTTDALRKLGFTVLDSSANFILTKHPSIGGREIYLQLKARGVLVRHFNTEKLKDYVRITIGSMEQMQILLDNLKEILEENNENS